MRLPEAPGAKSGRIVTGLACLLSLTLFSPPEALAELGLEIPERQQLIPILATTLDQNRNPIGVVAELQVALRSRNDEHGLDVSFQTAPGRFSPSAQIAVVAAIRNTALVAGLNPDSWTILLKVPYKGVTVYGTSLSAMVGLTVVALAQGHTIKPYRVMTGTVEPDGHIGAVSGIGLKLQAAQAEKLLRVLVPEDYDTTDGDWATPFLLHVSPVGTVATAYQALTDRTFRRRS